MEQLIKSKYEYSHIKKNIILSKDQVEIDFALEILLSDKLIENKIEWQMS